MNTNDLLDADFAMLCMELISMLGPTPVLVAYYADELGKPHHKVSHALCYLSGIGKARLDYTRTGARCYAKGS